MALGMHTKAILFLSVCLLGAGHAAAVQSLTEGNVLVSNGASLKEYTPLGLVVQTIAVPPVQGRISLRDAVVSPDGRLHVINYPGDCYLSTFDFASATWSQHTMPGWFIQGVTYYGGMSANSQYVFVPDETFGNDQTQGIIRFPLANLDAPERFATSYTMIHSTKVGLDGMLYALERAGPGNLHVFDPNSMALVRDVSVDHGASVESVAVAANGNIYTLDINGRIWLHDPAGNYIRSVQLDGIATDMELSPDGRIWLGSGGDKVTLANADLSTFNTFSTPLAAGAFNDNFVAFTEAQVPEPHCLALGAAACALLLRPIVSRRRCPLA